MVRASLQTVQFEIMDGEELLVDGCDFDGLKIGKSQPRDLREAS